MQHIILRAFPAINHLEVMLHHPKYCRGLPSSKPESGMVDYWVCLMNYYFLIMCPSKSRKKILSCHPFWRTNAHLGLVKRKACFVFAKVYPDKSQIKLRSSSTHLQDKRWLLLRFTPPKTSRKHQISARSPSEWRCDGHVWQACRIKGTIREEWGTMR